MSDYGSQLSYHKTITLQSEITLSTMQPDIIGSDHIYHELFPIIGLVLIYKDNDGALILILGKTLPLQQTHQSKHYHTKTTWF